MQRSKSWTIVKLLISIALLAGVLWAALHQQTLLDLWRVQTYQPPATIVQLATNTGMTETSRHLFYASQPKLQDKAEFSANCTNNNEQSIVLGCYKAQIIYLFDVTDERLNGVEEVTAAHEMLHAVYERLSVDDKKRVNAMLEPQLRAITDPRILALVDLYNKQEPGELLNEMHAILGTEYRALSPDLEDYYKQYFTDRARVVSYSERYEGLLSAAKNRIAELDARLAELQQAIDEGNRRLEREQTQLQAETDRLNALRQQDAEAYNAAVPGYNAKIRNFNTAVNEVRSQVERYNQLVAERNQQVGVQNDLYQSLDSRYQTVPQS